jgi:hypothetical protein
MNSVADGVRNEAAGTRYAVIFRTHFWDDFCDRQLRRLREQVGTGDIFVLVDETRGHVAGIPTERVFRLTDQMVLDAGYPQAGEGSIQWFSGDVPMYLFRAANPDYVYYVQLEYDVNVHVPLDDVIARVHADRADVVTLEKRGTAPDWYWMPSVKGVYREEEVTHRLICLSIFSGTALDRLATARQAQAVAYKRGDFPGWPFCEAYIPMEGAKLGLRMTELSRYGDTGHYDWWPPYPERALPALTGHAFVHPVLDQQRFLPSITKYPNVRALVTPNSVFHQRLRKMGTEAYLKLLVSGRFRALLARAIREKWERGRAVS